MNDKIQSRKTSPAFHSVKEIRLFPTGGYFITLVAQNRECCFGKVTGGKMMLNEYGIIVAYHWQHLPRHFEHIKMDVFQIMPNHLHGIIIITDDTGTIHSRNEIIVGTMHSDQKKLNIHEKIEANASPLRPHGTRPGSLAAIVQNFTSVTTRKINHIRKTTGQKFWQRNYWEHIIRNEHELTRIREYISNNPSNWDLDYHNQNQSQG